jgi:flagellar hook-associated protein 1 FlgK
MNATAIGLSTISAAEVAIDVVGQNVANLSTPGYREQSVSLVDQVFDGVHGVGVKVNNIRQADDGFIQTQINNVNAQVGSATASLKPEQQIESAVSSGAIDQQLNAFFNQVSQLTTDPSNLALRQQVLASASSLTSTLNQLANTIGQVTNNVAQSASQTVDQINKATASIAALNQQIQQVEATGQSPNDLIDQRSLQINNLSNLIGVQVIQQDHGLVTVIAANSPLVVGSQSQDLSLTTDPSGNYIVYSGNPTQPLAIQNGQLGAQLTELNQSLPGYQSQLDNLAASIIQNVDNVQATGLGLNGPSTASGGSHAVSDPTLPLNQAALAIPPQAGNLYISVTNQSTGQRTLNSIAIDPTTQSLQDVAAAITAATSGQVQGSVAANNTLQLTASAGYSFDFAGGLPTTPDNLNINGTTLPQVNGVWTGSADDNYTFQIVGNGTVGTTSGLALQVTNSANAIVGTFNIGQGYTPGTAINIGNGISVSFSAGTSNNGSFSERLIANPDSANILPALGVNTFFTGVDATTIAVNPALINNPSLLAASRSGAPGDGFNLERLAALQDAPLANGGTQTFQQAAVNLAANIGQNVQSLTSQQQSGQSLSNALQQQDQSVVGVDINTEMVNLLNFQRMLESGSQYLAVVNKTLQSIINIIPA